MAESLLKTATEVANDEAARDERVLHRRVQSFTEKWTVSLDLNKRDAAEFAADFALVVQAVHKDATRDISAILSKIMMAMPPPSVFIKKPDA